MSFNVLVKDGQGSTLRASGIKNAVKQAAGALSCKKADLHYLSIANEESDGFNVYFFDSRQADAQYWLDALKPSTEVLASGRVPN